MMLIASIAAPKGYAGSSQHQSIETPRSNEDEYVSTNVSSSSGLLRLKVLRVIDNAVGGDEAFQMLVPSDWKVEGGIEWRHDLSNLALTAMRISNPNGSEALEFFPIFPYIWSEMGIMGFPPGSNYLGNIVHPVISNPAVYIEQIVLAQFRPNVNPRIIDSVPFPGVAQVVAASIQEQGVRKTIKAEKIRVEYKESGKWIHEDFYCVLVYSQSPLVPGTTYWSANQLYSFKAEKGRLDEKASLLHTMISSVNINLKWFNKYVQVVQMWQQNQMQAILDAGAISRYIARTNDAINDIIRGVYENQQATYNRVNANFSRYVRGVESYRNPFSNRMVTLPSGYRDAWISAQEEYILSNNAGFDPNVGSTQTWRRMNQEH
jgi:hypothetical protein